MSFARALDSAIKKSGLQAKDIAQQIGISTARLSSYRHGTNPPEDIKLKLINLFGITETEKLKKERMTVSEAARRLGMSDERLRQALDESLFEPQIGISMQTPSGGRSYYIFRNRFDKYMAGEI